MIHFSGSINVEVFKATEPDLLLLTDVINFIERMTQQGMALLINLSSLKLKIQVG